MAHFRRCLRATWAYSTHAFSTNRNRVRTMHTMTCSMGNDNRCCRQQSWTSGNSGRTGAESWHVAAQHSAGQALWPRPELPLSTHHQLRPADAGLRAPRRPWPAVKSGRWPTGRHRAPPSVTRRLFFSKMASPLHQVDPPRPYDREIVYFSLISLICDSRRPSRLNAERVRKGSGARTWGVAGGLEGEGDGSPNRAADHRPALPSVAA